MRTPQPRTASLSALLLSAALASASGRGEAESPTAVEDTSRHAQTLAKLKEAQGLWSRQAPARYSITVRLACFCGPQAGLDLTGGAGLVPIIVAVDSGAAASQPPVGTGGASREGVVPVVITFGNDTMPPPAVAGAGAAAQVSGGGGPVEALYKIVQDAITDDADVIQASYDSRYGFPSEIFVDPENGAPNDESSWLVIEFRAL